MLRDPGSRALSEYYHFKVSRNGAATDDELVLPFLSEDRNSTFRLVRVNEKEFDWADALEQFQGSIPDWFLIQRTVMEPYNFIGLVERRDESLAVMKLLWNMSMSNFVAMSAKISGGYDGGRYKNTCFKIQKAPQPLPSSWSSSYISSGFHENNLDWVLYSMVNRTLDKTIESLGVENVNREAEDLQRLQDLVEKELEEEILSLETTMEATATLADALLDDLDDLMDSDDDGEAEHETSAAPEAATSTPTTTQSSEAPLSLDDPASSTTGAKPDPASRVSRAFLENKSLQKHLQAVRTWYSQKSSAKVDKERQEADHQLVVQSNKFLASLAEELSRAHGLLATAYKPKFPELEELLPNIVQYKSAVRCIGNEMDLTRVNDQLNEVLNSSQIIAISVSGSTTSGRMLTSEEMARVHDAANYMDELIQTQSELVNFVEQSMEALVPSISALIGTSTAAKLLGLAGGVAELAKIPACNLQVLGQVKQNAASRAGLSAATTKQHVGLLADCDLVRSVPKPLQKKALKLVAAKLALVARYDFVNVDTGRPRNAQAGLKYRHEIEEKFEKLQEPDKAPVMKALPKPDLEVKKRRGGKRIRKWKERFEETAMMKQANTRAFSSAQGEYGDDAMGITLGLLDTADSGGNIRKTTEKRKMRQANTKASRKRAAQLAQKTVNKDGLASSVVFSQSTSMELVNPEAQKNRVKEANRKWFDQNAGFRSALPGKGK
eukprot:Nitzschia sp. Nitz4//scaffold56_size114212//84467//87188//NITZ4_003962-RA/size114212-augustus-gene-0.86-mRNA-1//-1//CDS//3329554742//5139//frame0